MSRSAINGTAHPGFFFDGVRGLPNRTAAAEETDQGGSQTAQQNGTGSRNHRQIYIRIAAAGETDPLHMQAYPQAAVLKHGQGIAVILAVYQIEGNCYRFCGTIHAIF